jgi:hypothetical protein
VRGKKADHVALKLISLRLDKDVYDYLVMHYPNKIQATIRAVLKDYVNQNGERNDNDTTNI